jgi:predicted restriction endonuclease
MKRKRKYLSGHYRKKIWEYFDEVCQECGIETYLFRGDAVVDGNWSGSKVAHIDHIKPFSKGGKCIPKNFQLLCCSCNCSKGDK